MEHKDKKIKIDLDFLDKNAPEKSEKKNLESKVSDVVSSPPLNGPSGHGVTKFTTWVFGSIGAIALIVILAVAAAQQASNSSGNISAPVAASGASSTPPLFEREVEPVKVTTPPQKTPNEVCEETYGSHSYSTGKKDAAGTPTCDCGKGYVWNGTQTLCVLAPPVKSGLEICQDRNGVYATYDSSNNSCGCEDGYSLGEISQKCVSFTAARDEGCASSYPGTSFLKYDETDGKNICDCKAGYEWNDEGTACDTTASLNQACVKSYGQGSYSTIENGKRACDCGLGYAWDPQRTSCASISSINQLCERDVGRNSRYAGSSSDGKYNCTDPY